MGSFRERFRKAHAHDSAVLAAKRGPGIPLRARLAGAVAILIWRMAFFSLFAIAFMSCGLALHLLGPLGESCAATGIYYTLFLRRRQNNWVYLAVIPQEGCSIGGVTGQLRVRTTIRVRNSDAVQRTRHTIGRCVSFSRI
jgi:hypothetical protein